MCWLVIMCALALSRTGTEGAVISDDNTAVHSVDKTHFGNECLSKCVPRCQQLLNARDIHCCSCVTLCEKSCYRSFKTISNRVSDESGSPSLPWIPCANGICDLPEVAWSRLLVPRRTKRRPSRSPMLLREAAIIARSVGMDLGPVDTGSEQDISNSVVDEIQVVARLESLVQEKDDITALVSWDALETSGLPTGSPWYLVTWEPKGVGVRGNLLTNSTSASLTLWPNTVYHIQVSSTSHGTASKCLEVDTSSSTTPLELAHGPTRTSTLPRVEELGGVVAAVLMFLVVLLVSARRCRNRLEPSKNPDHGHQDCDRFKLYPPPVTLQHLAGSRRTSQQLPV